MKGGDFTRNEPNLSISNHQIYEPPIEPDNEILGGENQILMELGFDEGDIEMLVAMPGAGLREILEKYMRVANSAPYNINWTTEDQAIDAAYELNVLRPNGNTYTKHDIAKDVLNSYFHDQEMNAGKKRVKTQKRKNKKKSKRHIKKSRRNKSRRYY